MSDRISDAKKRNCPISLGFRSRTIQQKRMVPPNMKKVTSNRKKTSIFESTIVKGIILHQEMMRTITDVH
jgi:hypothetical protein